MSNRASDLFAVILDNTDDDFNYLRELTRRAGFRYVMASHVDVLSQLVELEIPTSLFILRFERQLNHQLRAYLDILHKRCYDETPILLLCNEQTRTQAEKVVERPIDSFLSAPYDINDLVSRTGAMLRRSLRNRLQLPMWLEMDQRIIYGRTLDISGTGMLLRIPDPILIPKFNVRVFLDEQAGKEGRLEDSVRFSVLIRRKDKQADGYHLGVQITGVLDGPHAMLARMAGVQFRASH